LDLEIGTTAFWVSALAGCQTDGLHIRGVDMRGVSPALGFWGKTKQQRLHQVTAIIRAVSLVMGVLVLSGVMRAQTKLDVMAGFGLVPPQNPQAQLIQGTDGNFYGTTISGGASNAGTVFQVTPTGALTILHTFVGGSADGAYPYASLVQGTDGNFYGTTYSGGAFNAGMVFQVTPTGTYAILHTFAGGSTDGASPFSGLRQGSDGNFYGTTFSGGASNAGTVFQVTPTGAFTILHTFAGGHADGAYPFGGLIQGTDGNFYGTTYSGGASNAGTVFQLTPTGTLTILHTFVGGSGDGSYPFAGLTQGADGNFYGTTVFGGISNAGIAFQLTPGGTLTVLHTFAGGSTDGADPYGGLVQGTDGNVYGTTSQGGTLNKGTVFQVTLTGNFMILHSFAGGSTDGANPFGGLIQGTNGNFFGTTSQGGASNAGTAFQVTSTGGLSIVQAFAAGTAEGAYPYGGLIQGTDGNFYTTTSQGGASSLGTVIQLTPAGAVTVLHTFTGGSADGAIPRSGLIQGTNGNFYGTTSQGGASNLGTVIQLTPAGTVTVLHAFTGGNADGANPEADLIQGTDGNFYGTTFSGGASYAGTVFQVTPTGAFTILHTFAGGRADGAYPFAGLVQGTDGNFYGTTYSGGASNAGTVFQLTPTGTLTILHTFVGGSADGSYPFAGLIQGTDGNLYGTTSQGGASNAGTVFQITPAGTLTILHIFAGGGTDGAVPFGRLFQGSDGNFYGTTTQGGVWNMGTVFQMTPAGALSVLYEFTGGTDGATPFAGVVRTIDGNIYGTSFSAGPLGGGDVYMLLSAPLPTITWNTPAPIVYGTTLSGAQLNATANIPGTFTYSPAAGTLLGAGANTITVNFTPAATSGYATAMSTVTLTVTATTPTITWIPPTTILFGLALDATQLNATANTPGTFSYNPPAGTVLGIGPQTLSVTFTPADAKDFTTATSSVTVTVAAPPQGTSSGGGNEHPLQFTPNPGYQGLVVAGYSLVANQFGGFTVSGNCSYHTVTSGSGKDPRPIITNYDQTCTWDLFGNLLTVAPGAPVVPPPLAVNGTQTIYASNGNGVFTGADSAQPLGGFVSTPGPAYAWITPNARLVLQQALYTFTATLQSDGTGPLNISSVQASAFNGTATLSSTTCVGQLPVGSTCAVTVNYDPTNLFSVSGLAFDTLTISVVSDAGVAQNFVQGYTIVLTPQNTRD
jgi:uncharacterized repeat protein (TIGR03803 family)